MKHMIAGLGMSVAVAIAIPAWAQTQMTPPVQSNAATPSGHPATTHHHARHHMYSSQNSMADRLNAEELATLQSGGPSVHRMPSGGKALTSPNR